MAKNPNPYGPQALTVQEATNLAAQRKQIVVTPALTTSAIGGGDVLINSEEIPNAVLNPGGCSLLKGITLIDYDDDAIDLTLIFTQNSATWAAVNAVPTLDAAGIKAANVLSAVTLDRTDTDQTDIINAKVDTYTEMNAPEGIDYGASTTTGGFFLPVYLQAATNSTSVYFSIITAANTWGAGDLEFHFNIEY